MRHSASQAPRDVIPLNWLWISLVYWICASAGCAPLASRPIAAQRIYQPTRTLDQEPQIQRGKKRPVIDTVGWVVGIPSKILLWDRRVDNHRIGQATEQSISQYVDRNGLSTVRVRLNQYDPIEDWKRLVRNDSVGAPWRLTIGALSVLGETVIPGRLFGGDHYNPYTDTIHIYSDVPAIGLHEGGHAKDFARRKWKGTYAFVYGLPVVPLYHESVATGDVVAYLDRYGSAQERAEASRILYPAYGTYVGSAAGTFFPAASGPIYYGSLITGHLAGWYRAGQQLRQTNHLVSGPDYLAHWQPASRLTAATQDQTNQAMQDHVTDGATIHSTSSHTASVGHTPVSTTDTKQSPVILSAVQTESPQVAVQP